MSSGGSTNPLPAASPQAAPPPLANIQFVVPQSGKLSLVGLNFMTQFWAKLQGSGGAVQQIETINNLSGDATFDSDTGELTVTSSEGRPFVASAFSDTTDADNIVSGTLDPARIADGSLEPSKLSPQDGASLLGNPTNAEGPVTEVLLGLNLQVDGTSLSACAGISTVAGLDAGAAPGTRGFVSDASAVTFASVVAGGGANFVPVYRDASSNWRIG